MTSSFVPPGADRSYFAAKPDEKGGTSWVQEGETKSGQETAPPEGPADYAGQVVVVPESQKDS
jgi:hypothetical protein